MHRATAASALCQSLLTNRRRSPHLLFTAAFPNPFNALILEDVFVDLHKYLLPSYYVITCIRLFFTKHYWGLFAANRFRERCPCHTAQKNSWQPLFPWSPYADWHAGVYTQSTASSWFYTRHGPSCGEEGLTKGNICICFSDIDRKKTFINWWI